MNHNPVDPHSRRDGRRHIRNSVNWAAAAARTHARTHWCKFSVLLCVRDAKMHVFDTFLLVIPEACPSNQGDCCQGKGK